MKKQTLLDAYKKWLVHRAALSVLDRVKRKVEQEKQPELIKSSGEYFRAITGDRYPRIRVSMDGEDKIWVYDENEAPWKITQLSRGTREQLLTEAINAVKYAKTLTDNVEFSAEDGSRSDRDFLCKVFEAAIDCGAKVVNLPDTVGYAEPEEFGKRIDYVFKKLGKLIKDKKVTISVHCHNDLGLAVANSLEAIKNGATQIECTINGIGERAGNCSLEEVVMNLKTRKEKKSLKEKRLKLKQKKRRLKHDYKTHRSHKKACSTRKVSNT